MGGSEDGRPPAIRSGYVSSGSHRQVRTLPFVLSDPETGSFPDLLLSASHLIHMPSTICATTACTNEP